MWKSIVISILLIGVCSSAEATTYTVNVVAPPQATYFGGRGSASGSASFSDVYLYPSDSLLVNVSFGKSLYDPMFMGAFDHFAYIAVGLNVTHEANIDNGQVQLDFPYQIGANPAGDGLSFMATARPMNPDPNATEFYDVNSVTYDVVPAPEPSTWSLALLGLFGVGGLLRRRGAAGAAVARS